MRSFQLVAAVFLALSTLAVSSPQPAADPFKRELLPRQTSTGRSSAPTEGVGDPIEGNTDPQSTEESSSNTAKETNTKSGDDNEASTKSGDDKDASTKKKSSTRTTRIPATAQVGLVNMKTPNPTDGYQIYKIGDTVTFEWNYTDVKVQPDAINVVAYCQDAQQDFTITGNASAAMTRVTWDTGEYESSTIKLLVATYTLNIFDAAKTKGAIASPGYLGSFNNYQFGLYTPREYKPLKDFECPTCDPNGASTLDRYMLRMMMGMGLAAVASFTWFMVGNRL
jgi:hypothetical protein